MHLCKLVVWNFRSFFGSHEIQFSEPGDNAVTIIHGENGAGKTNLLNAIFWCLTGEFTPRLSNPAQLVNKEAISLGDQECHVKIIFAHEGSTYRVIRSVKSMRDHSLEVHLMRSADEIEVSNPKQFIEKIIPKGLSRWFFFDAEAIGELKLSGSEDFKKSLRTVFGFELVDTLLEDLSSCVLVKQRQLSSLSSDSKLKALQEKIDTLLKILPQQKERAEGMLKDLERLEQQLSDVDTKLRELPKSRPLQERRVRLESQRKLLMRRKLIPLHTIGFR